MFTPPTAPLVAPAEGAPANTVAQATPAEAPAEEPPPPETVTPDPWPKSAELNGTKYTVYQPQVDSWNDYVYRAHAAVSVLPPGSKNPVFGVIELSANTIVDKQAQAVHLENLTVLKATFPSVPKKAPTYQKAIQSLVAQGPATMSLARLEAAVGIEGAERNARRVPVLNEPPRIVFRSSATVLVLIHGDPVWRPVSGTSLSRVLNTRACVLSAAGGAVYVHVLNGFMTAPSLNGPWTVATVLPPGAAQTAETLAEKNVVDLMQGPADDTTGLRPSLVNGAPGVVVATQPTEIIITQGPMNWAPLEGTQLLYVQNTNGNVFQDMVDQQYYVLVTGRWFRAPALTGPWAHVPGSSLPRDFSLIPVTSPKENVLASVPGTAEAQEAAISAQVPQMATIYRSKVSFEPVISGAPVLQPIPDTPLQYVFNTPDAIIMVSPSEWYAVQTGVWFTAPSVSGPWAVASAVPPVIYSIPPSAPLFYTTFVQIYAATPETVVVGYTPWVHRRGGGAEWLSRLRDGLQLRGLRRAGRLVPAARHLWLRGQPHLHAVDGLCGGLRHRLGRRALLLRAGALLGCHALRLPRCGLWGVWRRGRLGTARVGGHHRQHLPPVRCDVGRHPGLLGLQRLDGQRLEQQGGDVLQLRHRAGLCGPEQPSPQRLHREFRVQHARRNLQPQHRRRRRGQPDHRHQCRWPVEHLRTRHGDGAGGANHPRGPGR